MATKIERDREKEKALHDKLDAIYNEIQTILKEVKKGGLKVERKTSKKTS